jgi:hypothetical protein
MKTKLLGVIRKVTNKLFSIFVGFFIVIYFPHALIFAGIAPVKNTKTGRIEIIIYLLIFFLIKVYADRFRAMFLF